MSQGKRNYLEAKLHLQYVNPKEPKDAQQRILRGQAPYKRAKQDDQTGVLLTNNAEMDDDIGPIEDSSDSWDDGEVGMVNKPDYAAAFGFLDDEERKEEEVGILE